jgi:sulfur-oxidizing protein SoxZ
MATARIHVPQTVKYGQIFEVRVLIRHPMETGLRYNNVGHKIPKNIVHTFICRYNGQEVFHAELFPGIAANPYFSFFTTAESSGELECLWTDDTGVTTSERVAITVSQ